MISSFDIAKVPYPKDMLNAFKSKTPMGSSFSVHRKLMTPASSFPLKLQGQIKSSHETNFNIITNRDRNSATGDGSEADRLMTQAQRDYQDFSKSKPSVHTHNRQEIPAGVAGAELAFLRLRAEAERSRAAGAGDQPGRGQAGQAGGRAGQPEGLGQPQG